MTEEEVLLEDVLDALIDDELAERIRQTVLEDLARRGEIDAQKCAS